MSNPNDRSVSLWINQLKEGDETAVSKLWARYFHRLVHMTNRTLGNAPRRIADEEDVAVSAFNGLCEGAAAGSFAQIQNRDDLWSLVVAIAGRKAVNQIRRQTSKKRGGTDLQGDSVFYAMAEGGAGMDQMFHEDPPPSFW